MPEKDDSIIEESKLYGYNLGIAEARARDIVDANPLRLVARNSSVDCEYFEGKSANHSAWLCGIYVNLSNLEGDQIASHLEPMERRYYRSLLPIEFMDGNGTEENQNDSLLVSFCWPQAPYDREVVECLLGSTWFNVIDRAITESARKPVSKEIGPEGSQMILNRLTRYI